MPGLLVHEWAAQSGGSERVVEEFVGAFPDADLQVLWDDAPGRFSVPTYETWLATTPLRRNKALTLPLLPAVWRSLKAHRNYEWLLVSSHLFAHHVKLRHHREVPKLVYAHTPARYIWEPDLDTRGSSLLARAASVPLRRVDRRRAQEASSIAANSEFTAARVLNAWGREAEVIYPPVDVRSIRATADWAVTLDPAEAQTLSILPSEFLLGASRFVPYKRLDQVIAAGEATGIPVVIAGEGPGGADLERAASGASVSVHIVRAPSDALLRALYQRCLVYVFPAVEDFGIMPVEALAAGAPIVVPAIGGAAETARRTQGGAILNDESPSAWRRAIREARAIDRSTLPEKAEAFSSERFRTEVQCWVSHITGGTY